MAHTKSIAAMAGHRNWQREKMLRVDLQPVFPPTRKSA
jgi:hypothetical protein